jgi:DNA primase
MDAHEHLRNLPLMLVLDALLDEQTWKGRKSGTEWYGRCPIHQAKRNQTSFSFDDEGKFHCFSCGAKGKGAIDICIAVKQVNFREAVAILEELKPKLTAVTPAPKSVHEDEPPTENPVFRGSYDKFYVPSQWLSQRGLSPQTLQTFGVGEYDNPKRQSAYKGKILLPIRRWKDGELVAYLARTKEPTENQPKYLFPRNFQKGLEVFGAYQLKNEGQTLPLRVGYLVESPFCVMKFHQLGLPAVSPFGWSLSPHQAAILSQIAKGWIYLPDRNKFGEIAPSVALLARTSWVRTPELPEGVDDPEQLTREQILALT